MGGANEDNLITLSAAPFHSESYSTAVQSYNCSDSFCHSHNVKVLVLHKIEASSQYKVFGVCSANFAQYFHIVTMTKGVCNNTTLNSCKTAGVEWAQSEKVQQTMLSDYPH